MDFLVYAAVTHQGTVKAINEDCVVARAPVFLVADGISGCQRGALASGMVAERFGELVGRTDLTPELVTDTVEDVHAHVRRSQQESNHRAATTIAAAVAVRIGGQPYWCLVNAGDSRIYRVTGQRRRMIQVTEDHTHVQGMLALGLLTPEQAAHHPERNVLTQAVGSADHFDPDYWLLPMVAGERLLICSDGLLHETDPADVEGIVLGPNTPQDAVVELLSLALTSGARDNVSVVIVDVDEASWRRENS
ncbi:PP2C family protein-serine/threonine phosphatase [Granulicoccus sp. GXG6511]|uniref:PP2C family protein-serine/threonine phosphatase n=1 Tax=Granulicoccus sp. GXG6511 TaxID=3381351 RepID=UPI003D7E9BD7